MRKVHSMIPVAKTWLPKRKEYNKYLKRIWKSNILTNEGELLRELEEKLRVYLGAKHLFLVSSGTMALQIACKTLDLKGKFYTSPFTYIATASAPVWEGLEPVFVDMGEEYTKGPVVETHVYGIPRTVPRGIGPVIYDASHCFGVRDREGKSLCTYGDISIVSLHATKIFQSVEGGAIITSDDKLAHRINYMRHHGHRTRYSYWGLGINGHMSEFHAAMGLCMLPKARKVYRKYQKLIGLYSKYLNRPTLAKTYFPYVYSSESQLKHALRRFYTQGIYPRRYFYPALNTLKFFPPQECPVAEDYARRVLCLPLYYELKERDVKRICQLV